jgi:hypothetical protein
MALLLHLQNHLDALATDTLLKVDFTSSEQPEWASRLPWLNLLTAAGADELDLRPRNGPSPLNPLLEHDSLGCDQGVIDDRKLVDAR